MIKVVFDQAASANTGMPALHAEQFLGVPLHALTMEETLSYVSEAIQTRRGVQHVALNVAKFVKLRRDAELRADVLRADLVGVDGMGIVLGARLMGIKVPGRVAGVDLMERVLALCTAEGYRPYLVGARPEVLARAEANLKQRFPALRLAGSRHGYFSRSEEEQVVADIRAARADCLFVGMPTPRKERFMAAHRGSLDIPFVMGVGGGIDILAGHVRRAPTAWQHTGFEWLYRVLQEPRRMWWRYLSTNVAYGGIVAGALIGRAIHPRRSHMGHAA